MKKDKTLDTKEAVIERIHLRQFETERRYYLKRFYGITLEEYKKKLQEQFNSCAICGNSDAGKSSKYNTFCVDHDHKTGQIRGLLCHSCNKIVVPVIEYYNNRIEPTRVYLKKYGTVIP